MTAFLVVTAVNRSLGWAPDYMAHVPAIVRGHGGRFVAVSPASPGAVETLGGSSAPDAFAIVAFPSMDAIKAFTEDPAYAPYKAAFQAGAEVEAWAFNNWEEAPQFVGQ